MGLVGNWNKCIQCSSGKWIKFVFQDDLIASNCIEKLLMGARQSERSRISFCVRESMYEQMISPEGQLLKKSYERATFWWDLYPKSNQITPMQSIKALLMWPGRNIYGEPSSFLIRRDIFDDYGLFDSHFRHYCDLEYWLRVGVNENICFVNECLVSFRVHENSASGEHHKKNWLQVRYFDRVRLLAKALSDSAFTPVRKHLDFPFCRGYLKTRLDIFLRRTHVDVGATQDASGEYDEFRSEMADYNFEIEQNYLKLVGHYGISRGVLVIRYWLNRWIG
jgi:glycosyltransferase involved in cell wall biosynthesis